MVNNDKHPNEDDPFDNPSGAMVTVFKSLMKAFLEAVDTASKQPFHNNHKASTPARPAVLRPHFF